MEATIKKNHFTLFGVALLSIYQIVALLLYFFIWLFRHQCCRFVSVINKLEYFHYGMLFFSPLIGLIASGTIIWLIANKKYQARYLWAWLAVTLLISYYSFSLWDYLG